jgi:hypothetical protein
VTSESLVGGFVLPNTRVDVMCTTRGTDASARIILQNMLVLAVDTQDQRDEKTRSIIGQTVTLAATSEEATRLSLAQSVGELRLLLKNSNDSKRTETTEARVDDLKRPLHNDDGTERETRSLPKTLVNLPPVTEEPRAPEPVPVVKKEEPRRKRHVMTIVNGQTTDKAVFLLGRCEEDEDADSARKEDNKEEKPRTETKKTDPPTTAAPPPAKAATPSPATPSPAPSGAFGRSLRTGRIN